MKARSSRPSRSTTIVEPTRDGGEIERPEAVEIAVPRRGQRQSPRRRRRSAPQTIAERRARSHFIGFARDLERAEAGAAEAVGAIHVFRRRRRIDVMARRDGAHDIGDG